MNDILNLLKVQREVKYLLWSIEVDHKTHKLRVILSSLGMEVKIFGTEQECFARLTDKLFELAGKETRALKRLKNSR